MKTLVILGLCLIACVVLAADEDRAARTKRLYTSYCYACHGTGWQGAPMAGIASEWQSRIDKGWESVLKNAQEGFNGMPAKGTCEECSKMDLRALTEAMMSEQP